MRMKYASAHKSPKVLQETRGRADSSKRSDNSFGSMLFAADVKGKAASKTRIGVSPDYTGDGDSMHSS